MDYYINVRGISKHKITADFRQPLTRYPLNMTTNLLQPLFGMRVKTPSNRKQNLRRVRRRVC